MSRLSERIRHLSQGALLLAIGYVALLLTMIWTSRIDGADAIRAEIKRIRAQPASLVEPWPLPPSLAPVELTEGDNPFENAER